MGAKYVDQAHAAGGDGRQVTVLITEIKTKRRWHQILHNQTGIVLTANLIDRTDAIVANYPYRMN
ncbi:Probable amino acid permease [Mycobacteroides abscessus]|nr:Probable amino acid permease [Mycobacteroides abscessus]